MPYLNIHECLFNDSGEWKDQIGDNCLNDETDNKNDLVEFISSEI